MQGSGSAHSGAWRVVLDGTMDNAIVLVLALVLGCATTARADESERRERLASACGEYIAAGAVIDAVLDAMNPNNDDETSRALSQAYREQSDRFYDAARRVIENLPDADGTRLRAIAEITRAIDTAAATPVWGDWSDRSPGSVRDRFFQLSGLAHGLREAALEHMCLLRTRPAEPVAD